MSQVDPVSRVQAIIWRQDHLRLLDQRRLPDQEIWLECREVAAVVDAIHAMAVRGAPAIGIAAAYGVVLSAAAAPEQDWRAAVTADIGQLARSRPTAVNLFWALERMRGVLEQAPDLQSARKQLRAEAVALHEADATANQRMGAMARDLMLKDQPEPFAILTHCNTGSLATGGYGTALGAIRSVWEAGFLTRVYADETRPWLQGARLTAWELHREGLPVVLNCDSAAGQILRQGEVRWVIVGADRITANGDVANKIGTYGLAVLARHHRVRFMVVAPESTVDMSLPDGDAIPIEERDPAEITRVGERSVAPADIAAYNPVFDVTPAELIDVIVTEKGVVRQPTLAKMRSLFG